MWRFRHRFGQCRNTCCHGVLAPLPAGNHGHYRVRQPVGRRNPGNPGGGRDDRNALDTGRSKRLDRPAQHRSSFQLRLELVGAAHSTACACGHDDRFDRVGGSGLRVLAGTHSECICAKTIRPMTVWRTRVTITSSSVSTKRAPPSITTIVPSSR